MGRGSKGEGKNGLIGEEIDHGGADKSSSIVSGEEEGLQRDESKGEGRERVNRRRDG